MVEDVIAIVKDTLIIIKRIERFYILDELNSDGEQSTLYVKKRCEHFLNKVAFEYEDTFNYSEGGRKWMNKLRRTIEDEHEAIVRLEQRIIKENFMYQLLNLGDDLYV